MIGPHVNPPPVLWPSFRLSVPCVYQQVFHCILLPSLPLSCSECPSIRVESQPNPFCGTHLFFPYPRRTRKFLFCITPWQQPVGYPPLFLFPTASHPLLFPVCPSLDARAGYPLIPFTHLVYGTLIPSSPLSNFLLPSLSLQGSISSGPCFWARRSHPHPA